MTLNEIEIEDMVSGQSYACHFRIRTMLDKSGLPAQGSIGESFPGPGEYEGFGLIKTRDIENRRLIVIDLDTRREFTVGFEQVWGVDEVEFTDG
jgi:hypothetical protein